MDLSNKIKNFFIKEDISKIFQADAKVFNIQPPSLCIFLIGIFLIILIKKDIITKYINYIGIITFLIPIIYFLMWLLWRYSYWKIFIGERGLLREVKTSSALSITTIHTFVSYSWNQIKNYSIKDYGYRLYINKYNIFNMIFFIDIYAKKDSTEYKKIKKYLDINNILPRG